MLLTTLTATAIGRAHKRCGRNGQDACASISTEGVVVVAVADGCSAGTRSEVGAGVGARFVVADVVRRLGEVSLAELPQLVIADLVDELAHLARALGDVEQHLLFTIQCAVVKGDEALVFGVGDGLFAVDGRVVDVDEGPAPDYPAYALFQTMRAPRVRVHHHGPFTSSLAVCTDGAAELQTHAALVLNDGTALGGIAHFVNDQRYVKNASLAQKRMHAWCDVKGPVDDCTLAVIRRADMSSSTSRERS